MNWKATLKSTIRPISNIRFALEKLCYGDVTVLDSEQTNQLLARTLQEKKPQAMGKIGATELGGILRYLNGQDHLGQLTSWGKHRTMLFRNAGVFPADSATHSRFCRYFLEILPEVDVLVTWYRWGEHTVTRKYAPQATYASLGGLEPYYHQQPWSRNLAGKRVLAITPFARTAEKQYARRDQIWALNEDILPQFDLQTLKAPLSAALVKSNFRDWFSVLEHLQNEMARRTYDVAIIGAGAWSLPLAVHAKKMGKWALHLGGPTQILFGVKGQRWDHNHQIAKFFNQAWVRPDQEDRPDTCAQIEGGCYW